ncbi:MAG: fumarate reductase cytochrome b subunit [Gammaproteobacteria bacterium]|nr:fumarate reductase cytochrome b subunit [Gammaproteobacteria bacterium]
MNNNKRLIVDIGLDQCAGKSRLPALLDLAQSITGLILALFMWGHMFFVSSILLGKEAMYTVTKTFEGYYIFGESYPWIVSVAVAGVLILFIFHAGLAMRKFPSSYKQYKTILAHKSVMKHSDTSLWFIQVYTGFAMFFLGSAHLFFMLTHPAEIGPYASADRVWDGGMWPIYLLLLLAVELHGSIGLYRLAVKWGWLQGSDPTAGRRRLVIAKWSVTGFFLILGLLTLAAYIKIGVEHQANVGERYHVSLQGTVPGQIPLTLPNTTVRLLS